MLKTCAASCRAMSRSASAKSHYYKPSVCVQIVRVLRPIIGHQESEFMRGWGQSGGVLRMCHHGVRMIQEHTQLQVSVQHWELTQAGI